MMSSLAARLRVVAVIGAFTLAIPMSAAVTGTTSVVHAAGNQTIQPLLNLGTTSMASTQQSTGDVQDTEIDSAINGGDDDDSSGSDGSDSGVNRILPGTGPGAGPSANAGKKAKSNPEMVTSFAGLNFFNQRFANSGNQFSVEPPDQGLCAGNGYVLESVNDVLRVSTTSGTPLMTTDLNTFYGYQPAINRGVSPLRFGQSVTDPSCYYDTDTQRWFQVVLSLDRANPFTQGLSGANHLDIAVSKTADPTGSWNIYSLPVQNDGTQGTPNHHCVQRVKINGVFQFFPGPCLGDYPHIGADANGFYITTNEFNLAAPGFRGAQIYAISKQALVAGTANMAVNFDSPDIAGTPGFTVWPATSPSANYDADNGGTEFFMSSLAVFFGVDNHIAVTSLSNTQSLNSDTPALSLSTRIITTEPYAIPPKSAQKAGDRPLAQCLADTTTVLASRKCPQIAGSPVFTGAQTKLDSNDSRMQQVTYANGKLWGALDTALTLNGATQAGIAYFVIRPTAQGASVIARQGYLGLAGNNLNYPAVGVTPSGRGVIAFTVVGQDYYPSAGYASLDSQVGAGDIHIAAAGLGPDDGFTSYSSFNSTRARWGDYGATAVDGNSIWMASEYVGQTCTYAQFTAITAPATTPDFTCGGTRGILGNWGTYITQVTP